LKCLNTIKSSSKNSIYSQYGRKPLIIINLWTMANHLKQEVKDVTVGFRLLKLEKRFSDFLERLQNAGIEMIFTFKKSELKDVNFVNDMETDYQKGLEMIDMMRLMNETESLCQEFDRKIETQRYEFPFNQTMMLVLTQVAEKFGKLIGTDVINSRPSTSQVRLANQTQAMAIMGLNTHYIFYEGSWAFWSDADLDMDSMTIRQFDKKKILQFMGINVEQSRLFAILAGSLLSSPTIVERVVSHFGKWPKKVIENAINFVRTQRFPLTDGTLESIITKIFRRCDNEILMDFKRSLRLMNPNEDDEHALISPVKKIIKDDYASFAEDILEDSPIFICPNFLDLG
jgi:hypothetical protein